MYVRMYKSRISSLNIIRSCIVSFKLLSWIHILSQKSSLRWWWWWSHYISKVRLWLIFRSAVSSFAGPGFSKIMTWVGGLENATQRLKTWKLSEFASRLRTQWENVIYSSPQIQTKMVWLMCGCNWLLIKSEMVNWSLSCEHYTSFVCWNV